MSEGLIGRLSHMLEGRKPKMDAASIAGAIEAAKEHNHLRHLLEIIDAQGGTAGGGPLPVVSLEDFFQGNHTPASIACNLDPHPGLDVFYNTLKAIRDRECVHNVLVEIHDIPGENEWPFSACVYVIANATVEQVTEWVRPLQSDPVAIGFNNGSPAAALPIPMGHEVFTVWWD